MSEAILGLIVGLIAGAAACDHMWRKNFQKTVKNILAILEDKPPAPAGRKAA